MYNVVMVGLGGFIGAVLRYLISGLIQVWTNSVIFPYGTLAVNMVGCFIIGILSHIVEYHGAITAGTRLLLLVGLLGSFTTYSTFSNETINLVIGHRLFLAFLNIAIHIILGLSAVVIGRYSVIMIWR